MKRSIRRRLATLVALVALAATGASAANQSAPWNVHLQAVDAALARGDQGAARDAWLSAYAAALESGGWEALAAVGDATARIGANGDEKDLGRARQAYREAYVRARSEGSVDGVLRVSDASGRIGDHETARLYRDAAVRLAVRQASPGFFTRLWATLTRR
jgi:hypothetical protein